MPKLEATFVPGGYDDYYMPEVVAPSPQRVMPEVPQNMQDDLQRMELEARQPSGLVGSKPNKEPAHSQAPGASSSAPVQQPSDDSFKAFAQDKRGEMSTFSVPTFSPFPHVNQSNVPPSDDEKERILYNARAEVLKSSNVSVQLEWALDVLSWIEICQDAYARENKDTATRPQTPRIEHELRIDAINIVEYLASQNHPQAVFARSKWLEFGKFGFRQDRNEAFLGYMNAASRGWGRAEYRMGMIYENSNDIKNALQCYNRGLDMQDSASSYRLGMMTLLGQHGQTKDFATGLDLIRSAADTSDEESPQGAYVFGMLISRELPDINIPEGMLPFDVSQARQYIEKSAYFGFAKAQLKMGQAYELCQLGCDFNPALSLHYYGLAANQAQPEAALGVSRWFLFGYDGVFAKNEQLAFKYAKQAADAKLPTGEFAMGYYYEIGIYTQKDLREARSWYERAAEHGNKDALGRLEGLSQAKSLTKQDHETMALTRIKSKHGSMRGQRPERFSSRQKEGSLPALAESRSSTPDKPTPAATKANSPETRPTSSHSVSPSQHPILDMPDGPRPPAFAINIDQRNLAIRPKSTAPYPVDEKPSPLNLSRPKSTAPYPDDSHPGQPPLSPHYNPNIRASNGAQVASRPISAFGIRPVNMGAQSGPRPLSAAQTAGNLVPAHQQRPVSVNLAGRPSDNDPNGRITSAGWEPQVPTNYRGSSPSRQSAAGRGDYQESYDYGYPQQPQQQEQQQPLNPALMSGGLPQAESQRNRLSKTNPNPNAAPSYSGGPPAQTAQSAQPGRDYGPRTSSRPVSNGYPNPVNSSGRPDRLDSLPSQAPASNNRYSGSGAPGGGAPQMYKPNPQFGEGGRQSVPPVSSNVGFGSSGQTVRPVSAALPPRVSSAGPQMNARPQGAPPAQPAKPAKPVKQGPATFEEMGIPQGKSDDDCIIM